MYLCMKIWHKLFFCRLVEGEGSILAQPIPTDLCSCSACVAVEAKPDNVSFTDYGPGKVGD